MQIHSLSIYIPPESHNDEFMKRPSSHNYRTIILPAISGFVKNGTEFQLSTDNISDTLDFIFYLVKQLPAEQI